jgi:hypothetical protein
MTYQDAREAAGMRDAILRHLGYTIGKDPVHATLHDWRMALSYAVRDRIVDSWFASTRAAYESGAKRVYYLSMEFLIGRLLGDALVNLRADAEAKAAIEGLGLDFDAVLHDEPDAALGNGGLGPPSPLVGPPPPAEFRFAPDFPPSGIRALRLREGSSGNEECSARGLCDSGTGECRCFLGFGASDGDRGPGPVEDCGWREEVLQVRGYVRGSGDGPRGVTRAY